MDGEPVFEAGKNGLISGVIGYIGVAILAPIAGGIGDMLFPGPVVAPGSTDLVNLLISNGSLR